MLVLYSALEEGTRTPHSLVTSFLPRRTAWKQGQGGNFAVEKHGKRQLGQVVKVDTNRVSHGNNMYP